MAAYCDVNTDLKDVFSDIGWYTGFNKIEGWKLSSGQVSTFYVTGTGHIETVYDDGVALTVQTSIADVESNAGSYYYDSTNDILYVHATDSDDLTSVDGPTIEEGVPWNTLATRAINEASEEMDAYLNSMFSTPLLPRLKQTHAAEDYEAPIRRACAFLAARNLIWRVSPGDPKGREMENMALNFDPEPGEEKGIIAKVKDGTIALQDQITARETGHFNVYADSGNSGTGYIRLWGSYSGGDYEQWLLEMDTAGAPGTATWKLAYDGTTFDKTLKDTFDTTNNDRRIHLASGVYCVFLGTFVEGDKWTIEVFPQTDRPEGGMVSSSMVMR